MTRIYLFAMAISVACVPTPSTATKPLTPPTAAASAQPPVALTYLGVAGFRLDVGELRPDVAIVAVGLRDKVPDYTCRLLRALHYPARVIANHFDDWQEPLLPENMPLKPETAKDLEAVETEVHACAPHTRVEVPVHLQPISL